VPSAVWETCQGKNQAIQWMLVAMAADTEAARAFTHKVALKAERAANVSKQSAMVKLFASEVLVNIVNKAVQSFGGYRYIGLSS